MKKLNTILMTAMIGLLGACGSDNNNNFNRFGPNGFGGLACPGNQNLPLLETYTGNLGSGAQFVIELYDLGGSSVSAIGDIYIPSVDQLFGPGLFNGMGNAQPFASCLNGTNGSIYGRGTNAYRNIDMVLTGQNVTITLGDVGGQIASQLSGNNIIGEAIIQVNGASDIFVLTP